MTSESTYPELTTLKVVHNGIARRVKIPYDMDWKDFERKVCRLFNLSPPLITSYKDSMGVSVLVDNSEDFFFFLDEEYTGRLDIVISDLPESSDWTVVRTDTGKALKETEDPSEISVDEVHAINSPLTNSTRGSAIESPLFTSTKEHPELKSNYAGSEKDELESTRSIKSDTRELPNSVVNDQNIQNEVNSTSPVNEELDSIYEDSEESVVKEASDTSKYSTSDKSNLVTVEDEAEKECEAKEEIIVEAAHPYEVPVCNSNVNDILSESPNNDDNINNCINQKESNPREGSVPSEMSFNKSISPENSLISNGTDLGFFRDIITGIMPNGDNDDVPLNLATKSDLIEINDSVSNISKIATSKDPIVEILFEDDTNKASEVDGSVSVISEIKIPDEQNYLTALPEPFVQSESVKQIQDLRQLCFRFGDAFRRHPSLLTTVELFTDQLAHGVPINISVLEEGLNRLASSSESNITPSEAFEELATNLAGSVSQLVQHVGSTFSNFIERDVTPFINPRSQQRTSSQTMPETSQDSTNEKNDILDQDKNVRSGSTEKSSSFKECDSHHSRRHRCRRNRDNCEFKIGSSSEIGDVSMCKEKSLRSRIRHHSHPRRHARDSWLGKSNKIENDTVSKDESNEGFVYGHRNSSYEPSYLKDPAVVSNEHVSMKERVRPASLSPAPQIIPYYINKNEICPGRRDYDSSNSKLNNGISLNSSIPERKPQPYHFGRDFEPYRPLSFNDSIGVNPFSDLHSIDNTFSNHNDLHRVQICPAKPMDIPEVPEEKPADLGAEIDPADVALIEGLVILRSMGFHDDSANLEALQKKSSINQAVDYLLSR